MKIFAWDNNKNILLKQERGVSFEDVVFYINKGKIVDVIENPNKVKYQNQMIYVLNIEEYIYYVPFRETETEIYLITIIPSRKLTKKYLR